MRKLRLVLTPVTTMLLVGAVGAVGGASAYAGVVYAAKPVPTLSTVCVPPAGARTLTAPVRGACPRGTVLHRLPPGAKGLAGARGPAGPAGPTGATGTAGTNGKNGTNGTNGTNGKDGKDGTNGTNGTNGATKVVVVSRTAVVGPNTDFPFGVACAPGSVATGGGFTGLIQASVKVASSAPRFSAVDGKPYGWDVRVYNSGAANISATVYAVCAAP